MKADWKTGLPPNAEQPDALCPRYLVSTKWGVTQGWYNPDAGGWYVLMWFFYGRYSEDDIDFEKGDKPAVMLVDEDCVKGYADLPEPMGGS